MGDKIEQAKKDFCEPDCLKDAAKLNCIRCYMGKPVSFIKGDDVWVHGGEAAADNLYPCPSSSLYDVMEALKKSGWMEN